MNDSVTLNGPKNLYLAPQFIAVILDTLAEGKFKVVNPVIAEIYRQLKEQEPKPKEVNREEVNPAPATDLPDRVSDSQPADR